MNNSQDSKVTLAKDFLVTRKPADRSSLVLATQGNAIHRVRTHYLWEQNHSAKGDETRNAPVYT